MDDAVLQLLRDQHKDVMGSLQELKVSHAAHIKEDGEVHKLVERHTLYFNIAFLGIPVMVGAIVKKMGFTT